MVQRLEPVKAIHTVYFLFSAASGMIWWLVSTILGIIVLLVLLRVLLGII
jgi:hypothetical protein